jgi:transcriptional antiterminator RfaH
MPYWAVARTESSREGLAKTCLVQAGFEVLLPRVQTKGAIRPLFSNYLFVALGELGEGWHAVNRTIGIVRMVAFGDRPSRVPDREIEGLKGRMTDGGLITLPPPPQLVKHRFAKGEQVHIVGGPLAGFNGLHTGLTRHEREIILLVMLGAERRVMVAAHLVAAS